jgi:hypothetical protein
LVVCVNEAIARWCARPIEVGPGWPALVPFVLGPGVVPAVTDPDRASRAPEVAVLSALEHGRGSKALDVALAALRAVASLDDERALFYTDLVLHALNAAARKALEAIMGNGTYEYQSDFARKYFDQGKLEGKAEGKADGKASALIAVLRARDLVVPDDVREAILSCRDLSALDRWLHRALSTDSVEEIFEP